MEDSTILKNKVSQKGISKMKELVERPGKTEQHSTGTILFFRILIAMDMRQKTSNEQYMSIWNILLEMRSMTGVTYPSKAVCEVLSDLDGDKLVSIKKTTETHPATALIKAFARDEITKAFSIANKSMYAITETGLQVAVAVVLESGNNEDYSHFTTPGLFAHLQQVPA